MKDLELFELDDVTGGLAIRNVGAQLDHTSNTNPYAPYVTPGIGPQLGGPTFVDSVLSGPLGSTAPGGNLVSAGAAPATVPVGFDPNHVNPLGQPAQVPFGAYDHLGNFGGGLAVPAGGAPYGAPMGFPFGAQGGQLNGALSLLAPPQGAPQTFGGVPQGIPQGVPQAFGAAPNPLGAIGPVANAFGQITGIPQIGQIGGAVGGIANALNGGNPLGAIGPVGSLLGTLTGTPGLGQIGGAIGGIANAVNNGNPLGAIAPIGNLIGGLGGLGGQGGQGGGLGGLGGLFGGPQGGGGFFGF